MTAQLKHLRIEDLVAGAGGDPWELNRTIQSGSPGEISELADAFHQASGCLLDTKDEFDAAKQRFAAAWDRQDSGEHPINDSAEVRRATKSLQLNQDQLSRVAVDLQNIAAALAEAQRGAAISVRNLDMQLQLIDDQIDREIAAAAANGADVDVSTLRDAAVDRTRESSDVVRAVRDTYSEQLETSRRAMADDGYPAEATEPADGTREEINQEAHAEAEDYGGSERAADEALVNSPGPWTPEKQAAAARLRDYATINDPAAGVDEVRYAGERLNDFRMSRFVGPLPVDTVLGGDARTRAQLRQQWQRKFEEGVLDLPRIAADQATELLDQAEAQAKQLAITSAVEVLQQQGMSPDGAQTVADELSRGVPWSVIAQGSSHVLNGAPAGLTAVHDSASSGAHYKTGVLTSADTQVLGEIGKKIGAAGRVLDFVSLGHDLANGAAPGERVGKYIGGTALGAAGAWGTTLLAGSVFGPGGTLVAAVAMSIAATMGGEAVGGFVGSQFDR